MDVESLFAAALEKPSAAQRQAYLDEACAGDTGLRQRVERLLALDEGAAGILDRGQDAAAVLGAYRPLPPLEAERLFAGRFELREKLGEGGMGEVWVAEQTEPVKRRVALKVIRPGLGSARLLARFEQERQTLALMDHPNVGKVLDAGTADGRPFFVMELIDGVSITRYCDEARLPLRERLALFVTVCQAVQHAHTKGIIHRDLKPANILVTLYDGKPVPKVIDFGVAKAAGPRPGSTGVSTEVGAIIGTLEYLSPEQAEANDLDLDTRSDVYALGVLLYELLVGSVPFSRQQLQLVPLTEMLRIIKEVEPPTPSARLAASEALPAIAAARRVEPRRLVALVRGELDWVVMRCLEKDRARRYETASALAADVKRYLADELVEARPPSAAYRLRKFVRRNKGPVLAAGLMTLALLGGIAGTTLGLIEAHRQRDAAHAAAVVEKQAKATALVREAEARAILEFVESRIMAAARPEGQDGGLGRDVSLRQAIEAALPFVENGFADQPLIEARLRRTLARSFGNLGEARIAAEQGEKARAIYSKHLGPDHPDTLTCMLGLANCYVALGRHRDALALRKETLALMKGKLGGDDPRTLTAMNNLALSYAHLGQHDEALKLHQEALARQKALLGPDDPATLNSMNNLALAYNAVGRHPEALKLCRETVAVAKAKLGPSNRNTLNSMDSLAFIYHASGQHDEAVKLYEVTLPLMKDKLGPNHPTTLWTVQHLADVYVALGRPDEAVLRYEESLAGWKARFGGDHPNSLSSMNALARLLATSADEKFRNPGRAVVLARKAVELAPTVGHIWNTLGTAQYRAGDFRAAIAALEKSMALRGGGDSYDWLILAMAHGRSGDREEARKWYDRAIQYGNRPENEELRRFRAEAAALLKVKEKHN